MTDTERPMGKSRDGLILMFGKLAEKGGGKGLCISPSYPHARHRMQEFCDRLQAHAIPFKDRWTDLIVEVEAVLVTIQFMPLQSMQGKIEGMELNDLLDEASPAVRMSEKDWYNLRIAHCRVRERR